MSTQFETPLTYLLKHQPARLGTLSDEGRLVLAQVIESLERAAALEIKVRSFIFGPVDQMDMEDAFKVRAYDRLRAAIYEEKKT
jgi:hypothetical protein